MVTPMSFIHPQGHVSYIKWRSQPCVKRNHNPKYKYKVECRATQTPDKGEGNYDKVPWRSEHPLLTGRRMHKSFVTLKST
jgi:hypothetical protein